MAMLLPATVSAESIEKMYQEKGSCNRNTAQFVSDLIKTKDRVTSIGPPGPATYTYSYKFHCIYKNNEVYSWTDYINNNYIPSSDYLGIFNQLNVSREYFSYDKKKYDLKKYKIENNALVLYSCSGNDSRYKCDSTDQVSRFELGKRNPKYNPKYKDIDTGSKEKLLAATDAEITMYRQMAVFDLCQSRLSKVPFPKAIKTAAKQYAQAITRRHKGFIEGIPNKKLTPDHLYKGAVLEILDVAIQACPNSVPDVDKKKFEDALKKLNQST